MIHQYRWVFATLLELTACFIISVVVLQWVAAQHKLCIYCPAAGQNDSEPETSVLEDNNEPDTTSCLIPETDPWHPSLPFRTQPFNWALHCHNVQPELTIVDSTGILQFTKEYDDTLVNMKMASCQYRCFDRKAVGQEHEVDYTNWQPFTAAVAVMCDFVDVRCSNLWNNVSHIFYRNSHVNVHPQRLTAKNIEAKQSKLPSIIVIMLESSSKANVKRYLLQTQAVLAKMQTVAFRKHSKVGFNSRPNVIPFLTGKPLNGSNYDAERMDFIWQPFAKVGYKTMFIEEYTRVAPLISVRGSNQRGFRHKSCDHMFFPFDYNRHDSLISAKNKCYGRRPSHKIAMNYLQRFLLNYHRDQPLFAYMHLGFLVHNERAELSLLDSDYARLLTDCKEKLKNSWLFITGDHGNIPGDITSTALMTIESSNIPLLIKPPFGDRRLRERLKNNVQVHSGFLQS